MKKRKKHLRNLVMMMNPNTYYTGVSVVLQLVKRCLSKIWRLMNIMLVSKPLILENIPG